MQKFLLLSCLFLLLGQISFAQPTEELPTEWDGFRERLLTLALDPSVLAPVLAIVPIPPAGSEEVTEISRQLQQLLFLGLSLDLPRQLIHPPQLQRILDDWNGSLRLQSRPLTNRELAGPTISVSCESSTSLIRSTVGVMASSFSTVIEWDSVVFSPIPS